MSEATRATHYSVELEPDGEGWYHVACNCGTELGVFPTAEDGCDALMEHAYRMGVADGLKTAEMLADKAGLGRISDH